MMRNRDPELSVVPTESSGSIEARPDDDLMALCAKGYEPAFDELARRYHGIIRGFATRYWGNSTCADDVLQEVLVRIWQRRERYDRRGRFKAFIYGICLNCCREQARRRKRHTAAPLPLDTVDPSVDLEEALLADDRREQIERATAKLPRKLREAVLLRFFAGMSYSEIEAVLGASENALRQRVGRATQKLRKSLRELA